jgi:hypothetical protein
MDRKVGKNQFGLPGKRGSLQVKKNKTKRSKKQKTNKEAKRLQASW